MVKNWVKNHVFSLIAWILITIISIAILPDISQLTTEHSEIQLPKNVESQVAQTIQNDWGKKQKNTYQIAVVFNKEHGKLSDSDKVAINQTIAKIKDHEKEYGITNMLAPDDNQASRKQLQSKDGTTWIMNLNVSKQKNSEKRKIAEVEDQISKAAKTVGIKTYVTGADVLQHAFSNSIQEGIKKTELITVVFIFIVLVIVFRSPIVPLISLLTVGISFITSFAIVTRLVSQVNFPFSNFTQVFMVIVLFGIGTDYNILLYDKFKENLGNGLDKYKAMNDALKKAGKTILFSGSSVLIGFTALSLAKFSIYQSAVGVAVGVAVLLVVLLTLNPFFMATLGKKMFWPDKRFTGESEDKLWYGISKSTLKHPILYMIILAVVIVPFMLMYSGKLNYDDTAEIANNVPAKKGFLIVQKHFSKGTAEPSYLYIKSKHRLDNETNLQLIDQLTRQLQASKDVDTVASVTEPYGEPIKELYVNNQLGTVNDGVDQVRSGLGKLGKGSKKATRGAQRLADGASTLQDGTEKLQDGADSLQSGTVKLANGASKLQAGTSSLVSGTARLTTGAGRLESGTHALTSGVQKLVSGANRLQTGAGSLKNGTQQLVNGLNSLSNQLASQMSSSNKSQLAQLQTALPQINNAIQTLNSQVSGLDTTQLSSKLSALQDAAANAVSQTATQTANTTAENVVEALAKAKLIDSDNQEKASQIAKSVGSQVGSVASEKAKSSISSAGSDASATDLLTKLSSLQTAIKQLSAASNKALPGAATALNQLSSGLSQVQAAAVQGANGAKKLNSGASRLYNGLGSLSNGASRLNSGAGQLNTGISSLSAGLSSLDAGANRLNAGAGTLVNGLNQGASGASQLSSGIGQLNTGAGQLATGSNRLATSLPKISDGLNEANNGLGQGQTYLQSLGASSASNVFYIPKEYIKNDSFQESIKTYLSPDKKSAMMIIVFKSNPSAVKATKESQELSSIARKSLKGTALKNATVAMGGQSSKIEDTKNVASGDFVRTAAIMLIGIGIALMFVTRSILQPLYILTTLLVAYLLALSINEWIVRALLHRSMITWNTPFFSFIMLIALGVDYSIFLMTRYRELHEDGISAPSERILKACAIIGTVVVSAAIILGGTFAALIPSGIPTLIEVALTVIIGLVLLVFFMPMTMTATTKLTYEGINFSWGKKADKK